jgi:hypothetical protein
MAAWNDKRPGIRLGDMNGIVGLTAWCTECGRHSDIPMRQALHWWGVRTRARDVARDLRCKACGARRAEIKLQAPTWAQQKREELETPPQRWTGSAHSRRS